MKKLLVLVVLSFVFIFSAFCESAESIDLLSLLGMRFDSKPVLSVMASFDCDPEIDDYGADGYYYSYKTYGISFKFNSNNILNTIFVYVEGKDGFSQYPYELPYNLKFSLTIQDIHSIFGEPDKKCSSEKWEYWVKYYDENMIISFNGKITEPESTIEHIGFGITKK
jgi:hypothetical protein